VIDEINVAVSWKLLPLEKQIELMEMDTDAEIIMTGRYAKNEVLCSGYRDERDKALLCTGCRSQEGY